MKRSWFVKRCWSGPALALGVLGVSSAVQAEPEERLVYSAADGCPAEEDFVAAVRARGGSVTRDPSANSGEIAVAIERNRDGYRGTVRVRRDGQSSVAREVSSSRCSEVADGLAIVTALASQGGDIDAQHTTGVAPTTSSEPKAAPPPSVEAPQPPAEHSRLHTVGQFGETKLPVQSGEVTVKNDLAVTLSGGALFGVVPSTVVPRFDVSLTRMNFITTPDGEGHIIGGILRARWTMLGPTTYEASGASSKLLGFKAGIGGCSEFFYDLDGFVLLACGEIAAGIANSKTKDASGRTKEQTAGLGTASLELDARYNLSRLLHVGVVAGGEGWLAPMKVDRPDGSELFHTNPFGAYAVAGIGLHF